LATKMLAPTIQFSNNNPRNTHTPHGRTVCPLRHPTVNCPTSTSQPTISAFHNPSSTQTAPHTDTQSRKLPVQDQGSSCSLERR